MEDNKKDFSKEKPLPTQSLAQPDKNFNLEAIITAAITQKVPVETLERLLAMAKEMQQIKAKQEFDRAMAQFQADCPVIEKKKIVYEKNSNQIRYKYAPIDSIVDQVKKPLAENGLSYTFDEVKDDKFTEIVCIVTHVLGHSQKTGFKIPIGTETYMSDVQKYGARMTFGKRYAFCNALGIMTGDEDNDGANLPDKSKTNIVDVIGISEFESKIQKAKDITELSSIAVQIDNVKTSLGKENIEYLRGIYRDKQDKLMIK